MIVSVVLRNYVFFTQVNVYVEGKLCIKYVHIHILRCFSYLAHFHRPLGLNWLNQDRQTIISPYITLGKAHFISIDWVNSLQNICLCVCICMCVWGKHYSYISCNPRKLYQLLSSEIECLSSSLMYVSLARSCLISCVLDKNHYFPSFLILHKPQNLTVLFVVKAHFTFCYLAGFYCITFYPLNSNIVVWQCYII